MPAMIQLARNGLFERMCKTQSEQRVFTRVPYQKTIRWRDAHGETGAADLLNISRGGLSLSLTRYLRPGPALVFYFDDIFYRGLPVELSALTVWSRPVPDDHGAFLAGFSLVHGQLETLGAISEVFYAALREQAVGYAG